MVNENKGFYKSKNLRMLVIKGLIVMKHLTHDKLKIGADLTWILITGFKQIIMLNELYTIGHY